jgi:signal transduction histidine kinase
MVYLLIGLTVIIVILSAYLIFLRLALSKTTQQMEDIEKHPERNRQLKAITNDTKLEELLNRINYIYRARQQERIVYQRSETKIRREIENISHDLRTPLTSILGYLELMEESTSEQEKAQYLDIIRKRAKVLQGFIQDFYEISRIEGDDYPLLLDAVAVQGMLKDTVVAYYRSFEDKRIEVSVDLEEKPVFIIADKIQFNRILNNLIQNALKYAEKKFILRQFIFAGSCILQFMNDRNNIPEEEIKLIFERFYSGDKSRGSQSTGLGLTITKILVEKMKGTIEARFEDDLFVIEIRWPLNPEQVLMH